MGAPSTGEVGTLPHTDSTGSHQIVMVSFAIQLLGLLLSMLAGELLHQLHWTKYIPESGSTICIGVLMGSVMYATAPSDLIQVSQFSETLFFLVLLPIVIYESGYSLYRDPLFAHILPISLFAVVGTTVSAAVTSGVIILAVTSPSAPSHGLPALSTWECVTLGALLSATDPVATLTVFSSLRVEPVLNALVYGESVLNDAVGIVLFRAAAAFITVEPTSELVGAVVWNTAVILVVSVAWGVGVGLVCTRALSDANVKGLLGAGGRSALANAVAGLFVSRSGRYSRRHSVVVGAGAGAGSAGAGSAGAASTTPGGGGGEGGGEGASSTTTTKGLDTFLSHVMLGTSETSILLVFGYASFASAEALGLSGIIASLFCGITQAAYARPIMSWPGKKVSTAVLRLLAGLADTAIFLQIGLGLALLGRPGWGECVLAVAALVGCLLGRAAHVFPLSAAINAWEGRVVVSQGVAVQMWWAGLRGGIAFASAVSFPSASHAGSVGRAVGLLCCATIALMGPTTVPLLRAMAIPFGEDTAAGAGAAAAAEVAPFPHTPAPPLLLWAQAHIAPWVYGRATLAIIRDTSDGSVDSEPVVVIRTPSKARRSPRSSGSSSSTSGRGDEAPSPTPFRATTSTTSITSITSITSTTASGSMSGRREEVVGMSAYLPSSSSTAAAAAVGMVGGSGGSRSSGGGAVVEEGGSFSVTVVVGGGRNGLSAITGVNEEGGQGNPGLVGGGGREGREGGEGGGGEEGGKEGGGEGGGGGGDSSSSSSKALFT